MQFQRLPLSIMKSKFSAFFLIVSLCTVGFSHAQSVDALLADEAAIRNWQAGKTVNAESVSAFCEKSCFVAKPIPDAVFRLMQGKSFPANATIKRDDLRYLQVLHYDAHGKILIGELVTNKAISRDVLDVLNVLYEARYPIERMVLIDQYGADDERSMTANNSSAFNFRFVAGTRKLSNHSTGRAVDINPLYNPFVVGKTVSPATGRAYADRSKDFLYKIEADDLCVREFKKRGFEWGGDWKTRKDYQHFEKKN